MRHERYNEERLRARAEREANGGSFQERALTNAVILLLKRKRAKLPNGLIYLLSCGLF